MLQHESSSPASNRLRRIGTILLLALMLPALSSCGVGVCMRSLFGSKLDIEVSVADLANQDNPVAMEVLLVYDEELLQTLLKMSARQWFEKREQLRKDYPGSSGFDSWEWEWIPGQQVSLQRLPLRASAKGAIIYANYFTPGEHRIRIHPHQSVRVNLGFEDFTVEPL